MFDLLLDLECQWCQKIANYSHLFRKFHCSLIKYFFEVCIFSFFASVVCVIVKYVANDAFETWSCLLLQIIQSCINIWIGFHFVTFAILTHPMIVITFVIYLTANGFQYHCYWPFWFRGRVRWIIIPIDVIVFIKISEDVVSYIFFWAFLLKQKLVF